jgi:3-hydroxyisobutyrate dehydrogenase-like beta-hydroxyacid dehydrogenase
VRPVTIIGLGPMGQAMARVLLASGHDVTVWNRTPSRAAPVVAAGAKLAQSVADALAAAELVILSLTDYQAMFDILESSAEHLDGRVIVNLSSDTPARTRDAATWAGRHGARFVAGGVMVPAPLLGSEASYVYYSGPKATFDEHEPTLRLLGAARWLGEDPGLAQLFYQAQLDVFLTSLSGLLHAIALVGAAGVTAERFVPEALGTFRLIDALLADPREARDIDAGVYPGALSTTTMMGATADHIVATSEAAGIDLALPHAVQSHYARAIAAGHGNDGWTSLIEVIKATEHSTTPARVLDS